jgi:AcrR family transcriptional regulator
MPVSPTRLEFRALADDRIMQSIARQLQDGVDDLTFRRLAELSGVPERTLFRYYPSKSALMEAFWTWLNAKLEMPAPPDTPDEFADQVPALFAAFETDDPLVRAMLHDRNGRETRVDHAPARRERLRLALQDLLAGLTPEEQTNLLASVQLLASAAGWESMKDNWDLTGEQAAKAAQWAVKALLATVGADRSADRQNADLADRN